MLGQVRNARSIMINLPENLTSKWVIRRQINIKYSASNSILRPQLLCLIINFGKKFDVKFALLEAFGSTIEKQFFSVNGGCGSYFLSLI